VSRARLIGWVVLVGAGIFALAGGEYGAWDWFVLERQRREQQSQVARLQIEVDSLRKYLQAVRTDRRLQEKIAREEFGMIRKGEYLYRIEPDTASGAGGDR
jgi:cell division protein FtsB